MPDFGLTSALEKAVAQGVKGARVMRPAESELLKREAAQAAAGATANETGATATAVGPEPIAPKMTPETAPTVPPVAAPVVDQAVPTLDPTAAARPVQTGHSATTHGVPAEPAPGVRNDVPTPNPDEGLAGIPPSDPLGVPAAAEPAPRPQLAPAPEATPEMLQATRISRATLGDYALDQSHMPNFDVMDSVDSTKATIAHLAEQDASKIDEARRGVITNQQLLGLAQDVGSTPELVAQTLNREVGGTFNAETIIATRQLLSASADRISSLADKIASGMATDLDKVQFARQIQLHKAFFRQFMGARAEAGRALNALSIPVGANPEQIARMSEIIDRQGGDLGRMARAIKQISTVDGLNQAVSGGLFRRISATGMNLTNRLFVNGILSGPVTHFVNMLGNATFQVMNTAELAVAARLGKFLPGTDHVQLGEALANWHGMIQGTTDAWRLFKRAVVTGDTLDGVLRYDATGRGRTGTLADLPGLDKGVVGAVVHGLDTLIDVPTRLMGAEDEWFKAIAYRGYMQRQTFLHVSDQLRSGQITMEQAAQTAKDFIENAPEEVQAAAEKWAREATFQNELGPIGQNLSNALRKVPVLTLIVPFVRTPVNIFKEAAARGPMAVATARFWGAMQAGGRDRDLALTRFAMGSTTAALMAHWVMNDNATGAGPSDPHQQQLWQANGRRPYSFKVTDPLTGDTTWHSYARIEPMASVMGATADAVEILAALNSDKEVPEEQQKQVWNAISAIIIGVMNNTGNKTFMKGASDFIELLNDPARNVQSFSNQIVASMVPYSALSRSIRNTQDPYLREAWTILDKVRDNIPGYSKGLPLRLGLFGETRDKNSSTLMGVMSPMPESPQAHDPVVTELQNVMRQTGSAPITMPEKIIQVAPQSPGLHLTAAEYSNLVQLSRNSPIFDGVNFKEKLASVIDTEVYQAASPMVRANILQNIQHAADQSGRAALEAQNPDFAVRAQAWRQEIARLKFAP